MTRDSYLKKSWKPYPPARQSWLDVSEFLAVNADAKIVAGRMFFEDHQDQGGAKKIILKSNGDSLALFFPLDESRVTWLEPQLSECDFEVSLLMSGDLIAAAVKKTEVGNYEIEKILLLAPNRAFSVGGRNEDAAVDFDVDRSRLWAQFLKFTREFFEKRSFIEAQTPTLVPSPGTEPFLDPFKTQWNFGSLQREFYLPTSPEFHLKKMLALGWTKIFELKPCFRNGEISETHQPEFLMLEWYRAYNDLDAIADDVEAMITELALRFQLTVPKLRRVHMKDLFEKAFPGFQLRPDTSLSELQELARKNAIEFSVEDSWDDVFFRLFLEKIENHLGSEGPLLVRGYPPSQAALSRIGEDGFADRFEVYWHGLELANAFHELNDPAENVKRFEEDARRKAQLGKEPVPIDQELVSLIASGLPPSGGIALGLDRLFMAAFGFSEISQVRAFPVRA